MKKRLYIAGEWVDASEHFDAINPFTTQPWATIPQASAEQVETAIGAARHAFEHGWKQTTGLERARLMCRLADLIDETADEFSQMESTDNGILGSGAAGHSAHVADRTYRPSQMVGGRLCASNQISSMRLPDALFEA